MNRRERESRTWNLRRLGISIVCFVALFAGTSHAVSVSLNAINSIVEHGNMLDLHVEFSELGDGSAPSLGVFDLNIVFDSALVTLTGGSFGDPTLGDQLDLLSFGSITSLTEGSGTLNLFELSFDTAAMLDADQAASFIAATLNFSTVEVGEAVFDLSVVSLGDSFGTSLQASTSGTTVSIQAVIPEPSAALLFPLGMLLFAGAKRRA